MFYRKHKCKAVLHLILLTIITVTDLLFSVFFKQDECLLAAGGRSQGTMDFWQIHIYPYQGRWSTGAPWNGKKAADYGHDGPLVIGEYPTLAFEVVASF